MNNKKTVTAITINKRIFFGMIISLLVLFGLYGYFISKSIVNVLIREEIEQKLVLVNSDISDLEFRYLEHKDNINLSFAYSQGFQKVDDKKFVERKSTLGKRLTLNSEVR